MRIMIKKCLSLLMAIVMVSFYASPVKAQESSQPPIPAPIQSLVDEGAQLRYLGRDSGLDGWVVLKSGQEQYYYVTPDGEGIVMGVLFNSKGDTVTLRQVNALRKKEGPAIDRLAGFSEPLKPDEADKKPTVPSTPVVNDSDFTNPQALIQSATKSKSERLFDSVVNANWIRIGSDKAPPIYTFIDPQCPHCHDFVQKVRQSGFLDQGLVQLRLIPVGVLSEESLIEAAYLLASPDPQKDFFRHLDGDKDVLLSNKTVNTQGVQRNIQLMQEWKLDVTPFSVYRARDGKVKIMQGPPEDVKEIIKELR